MVYVLSKDGEPLMPTKRHGKVRRMLKEGQARVVNKKPFTIQLCHNAGSSTQPINIVISSNCQNTYSSVSAEQEELLPDELGRVKDIKKKLNEPKIYKNKKTKKRYRKQRKKSDNSPESLSTIKLEKKMKLIEKLKKILPITESIIKPRIIADQKNKKTTHAANQQQEKEFESFDILGYLKQKNSRENETQARSD